MITTTTTNPHAGAAVDGEHKRYEEVEASLAFLQERLEAAEQAGVGEEERYQHTTAELHEQLQAQASQLVECQHRIANLKDELEASRQRLQDEQDNEAALCKRAQALEAEAAAAGQQLQRAGVDAAGFPGKPLPEPLVAAAAAAQSAAAAAVAADGSCAAALRVAAVSSSEQEVASPSRRSRWAAMLEQDGPAAPASAQPQEMSRFVSEAATGRGMQPAAAAADASDVASTAAAAPPPLPDMAAVRRHVEEMAAQYVEKLSVAEAELQAVRTVWQQAEGELAALRLHSSSSPRGSPRAVNTGGGGSGGGGNHSMSAPSSPRGQLVVAAASLSSGDWELMARLPPSDASQRVSGSSHAGADADHGTAALDIELPSPRFGPGGHVGAFPQGDERGSGGNGGRAPPVVSSAIELPPPRFGGGHVGAYPAGDARAAASAAAAAAVASSVASAHRSRSAPPAPEEVARFKASLQSPVSAQGARSTTRVRVHMMPQAAAQHLTNGYASSRESSYDSE
jgi:hypothetical protein